MARSDEEAIETFMSITGASEDTAIRLLEEHHGDLNEAINAHFSEGDRSLTQEASFIAPQADVMDTDEPIPVGPRRRRSPRFPFARDVNPFSLLDNFASSIFDQSNAATWPPYVSHPREVREIPIEVKDEIGASGPPGAAPTIEDVTETVHEHGPEIRGTVTIDDDDNDDGRTSPEFPLAHAAWHWNRNSSTNSRPNAPVTDDVPDYDNDIEEEMIRAAIEASKREAAMSNQHYEDHLDPRNSTHLFGQYDLEDPEIARAASLSLQDDEYLASLQADRDKELKAMQESEAAFTGKKREDEELHRKLQEDQEIKRQLTAKEASLPAEPTPDDENAVTLLVRMPDGSRLGRRFLKSDKLQCLFDFIDVGGVVKPGSYKLVRPYPRRAFSDSESVSTLHELDLTSKQEALYLELI